jgi:hypothetical protein
MIAPVSVSASVPVVGDGSLLADSGLAEPGIADAQAVSKNAQIANVQCFMVGTFPRN